MDQQDEDVNRIDAKRLSEMDRGEKIGFFGRVLGFIATFGFLFPNVFVD